MFLPLPLWKRVCHISTNTLYTTIQNQSVILIKKKKKLIILSSKDALNWSKVAVTKNLYFKLILFFWIFNSVLLRFHKILSSTTLMIVIRNVSWAPNQYIRIRMISKGSCDTEDWRNGCWKFSFAITEINYILKHINIKKTVILNCNNNNNKCNVIIHFYCFWSNICSLLRLR